MMMMIRTAAARRAYTTGTAAAASQSASASKAVTKVEPIEQTDVAVASGAPELMRQRAVRIFRPAKTAMQSGNDNTRFWKLEWNNEDRWTNPLMGWASSADYQQATFLKFRTEEEAVRFAERQGYQYEVVAPPEPKFVVKSYATNFHYKTGKLRFHHTK
ncbi:ndufs4 NADH dehydrogenase Fe-S protein subunit [Blastocladiella emersonii ATCC 22665]|nr:ndufs4 NADH dehydrogenase Fe-S protein subunit [Blastocladiella emersonii ATCC 22665]